MKTLPQYTVRDKPHIIVTGDPVNGFEFYGPFKSWHEACDVGDSDPHLEEEVWWPAPLEETRKGDDSISPSSRKSR